MAKRGGFPGGMPGNMNNLMKQAQKMQKQMEEAQKQLEEQVVEAAAGGGAVNVKVSGKKERVFARRPFNRDTDYFACIVRDFFFEKWHFLCISIRF